MSVEFRHPCHWVVSSSIVDGLSSDNYKFRCCDPSRLWLARVAASILDFRQRAGGCSRLRIRLRFGKGSGICPFENLLKCEDCDP